MAGAAVLKRLQQRATQADQLIAQLRKQLSSLQEAAVVSACRAEEEKLRNENNKLKAEVDSLVSQLCAAETRNGVPQIPMPSKDNRPAVCPPAVVAPPKVITGPIPGLAVCPPKPVAPPAPPGISEEKKQKKKKEKAEKKEKKAENKGKGQDKGGAEAKPLDVSRLNMRIGHIVNVKKHPDADGLYVEEVNVGEERNRTIVSGLVKHVPLEQMQDRMAIFMLNLKPAKMRGIMSEGMIMCGSSPEKVEIIEPPAGVTVGQRITVEGYTGEPDGQLNPKKKIWEQIQPDLRINAEGLATYKGVPWRVEGEGDCKVPTMRDSGIR